MLSWKSVVGKLWLTIMGLVALVLVVLGLFLLQYINMNFANSKDVQRLFIYTAIIGFLLTTFFALFLSTKITKPLLELKKAADSISKGDFTTKVRIYSHDEIGQLGRAFNLMGEQLQETIADLMHEKEHLGNVLRSMTDAVMTFDATGRIILVNPHGEKLLQHWGDVAWNDEQQVKDWGDMQAAEEDQTHSSLLHKAVPEPLRELYASVVNSSHELTAKLHVRDGVWSVVLAPLYTNEQLRGAVAVLRDVTEEHRLDKLRKDFVANVSHELRTPLSMLQGYSEALLDDIVSSPEERKELAQIIHDESLRMSRLVKNLLDLATMEAGHLKLQRKQVAIDALIERVVRKFTTAANPANIVYVSEQSVQELDGDEDRLEQVLYNLIDNAIRHSPDCGKIEVRCSDDRLEGQPSLLIEVEDEGRGIHAEDIDYVFERFYKADKARKRDGSGGTGLGLSIVKNIVEAHGGQVQVRSVFGEGTVFSVRLPLQQTAK